MNFPLNGIFKVGLALGLAVAGSGCSGLEGKASTGESTATSSNQSSLTLEAKGTGKSEKAADPVGTTNSLATGATNVGQAVISNSPVQTAVAKVETNRLSTGVATNASNVGPTNAVAADVPGPIPPKNLAPSIAEVARLAESGVNEQVMQNFVEQSTNTFKLGAEELIYLSDLGVAPAVIAAMQLKAPGATAAPASILPAAGPAGPVNASNAPAVATAPTAPATTVITPNYVNNPATGSAAPPPPAVQGVAAPAPVAVQPPVTVTYFYDALSPYGTWVDVEGYGRCWRPDYAVLGSGWRPYADGGRWIWSDHGWYWVSDYSWGWAPFHYGRWHHHLRHGWVWYPDTVWGPAWVCWRRTSSHCGWAPLPPGSYFRHSAWWYHDVSVGFDFGFAIGFSHFTFIPWGRFCDSRPHHYYASRDHATRLYSGSTVVNNTIVGNNNTIIYEGVGRQAVARSSRTPIPQASIRETAWTSVAGPRERLNQGQNGIVVDSPRLGALPPQRPGANPVSTSQASAPGRSNAGPGNSDSGTAAERNGREIRSSLMDRRDGVARSGRTGFDPVAGSVPVFIPSTRSGVSANPPPATAGSSASPSGSPRSAAPSVSSIGRASSFDSSSINGSGNVGGSGRASLAEPSGWSAPRTRPNVSPATLNAEPGRAPGGAPLTRPVGSLNPRPQTTLPQSSSISGADPSGGIPSRLAGSNLGGRSGFQPGSPRTLSPQANAGIPGVTGLNPAPGNAGGPFPSSTTSRGAFPAASRSTVSTTPMDRPTPVARPTAPPSVRTASPFAPSAPRNNGGGAVSPFQAAPRSIAPAPSQPSVRSAPPASSPAPTRSAPQGGSGGSPRQRER